MSLVNDVLNLSKVEAGRMVLSRDWTSPGELIGAVQAILLPSGSATASRSSGRRPRRSRESSPTR